MHRAFHGTAALRLAPAPHPRAHRDGPHAVYGVENIPSEGFAIAVLRCAEILTADISSQLWDYLDSRVCVRPLGFDPRIHVRSVDDALDAVARGLASEARGVFHIPASTPCRCRA